jgi:hypothetical protein
MSTVAGFTARYEFERDITDRYLLSLYAFSIFASVTVVPDAIGDVVPVFVLVTITGDGLFMYGFAINVLGTPAYGLFPVFVL